MAEFRALPWGEQQLLREGVVEEFSRQGWEQAAAEVAPPPGFGGELPVGEPSQIRSDSLESLAGMGLTVMEV